MLFRSVSGDNTPQTTSTIMLIELHRQRMNSKEWRKHLIVISVMVRLLWSCGGALLWLKVDFQCGFCLNPKCGDEGEGREKEEGKEKEMVRGIHQLVLL